jgi:stage V sporulation protein B
MEEKLKYKKSDFLEGIISLVISQILIKIFGVIYTLYLTNRSNFGDTGNAIYMSGYQIYALLLTISSIGVPNAISKIISENNSIKDYENSRRIFLVAIFLFATIGFLGSLILFFGANFIAEYLLKIPESALSIKVLSPAIFFVSITSVIRGYCNGENKISVTATSQFFEQVLKTIFTIVLVEIFARISNNNTVIMAATANFATTLATMFSLIFIIYKYFRNKK